MRQLIAEIAEPQRFAQLFSLTSESKLQRYYLHWDKLRHFSPPPGVTHRERWMVVKLYRMDGLKPVALLGCAKRPFQFAITEQVMEALHQIDLGAGGLVSIPEPITNPQTRDRYLGL